MALEAFVFQSQPPGTFWNEISAIATGLPRAFGSNSDGRGTYLQELATAPQAILSGDCIESWELVAKEFFQIESASAHGLRDGRPCTPFLFHIARLPGTIGRTLARGGSIEIEAGNSLNFEVHTITGSSFGAIRNPFGEILFELSHPAATFVSSRRVRIDSRRDVRRVSVSTSALFRRASGHLSVRTVVFNANNVKSNETELSSVSAPVLPANKRDETIIARYDFPLRVGRWIPWLASALVATAAALAAYKQPDASKSQLMSYLVPLLTFFLAFAGLVLGLRREGKG